MRKLAAVVGVCILFCGGIAGADQKGFVWTTEYQTLPKGGMEVEYWLSAATADVHHPGDTAFEHQIELEYGITNNWDASIYQIFGHGRAEDDGYKGMKLETRYLIGEAGKYFVDPLIYLEYKIGAGGDKNEAEAKLVLAKEIGKLAIAYNQTVEYQFGSGGRAEHEYAVGASYPVGRSMRFGVEGKGSYTEREHAVGPTVSWVAGRFWAALGVAFGLNRNTDDLQIRIGVGIPF